MGRLDDVHALLPAVSHPVVLAEVAVHTFEGVVGFARYLRWVFAFEVALATDDGFVGHSASHVVEGGPAGNDFVVLALPLTQQGGDGTVVTVQQQAQVDVGEDCSLSVCFTTQAQGSFESQVGPVRSGSSFTQAVLDVVEGAEGEDNRNLAGLLCALSATGTVVEIDGLPDDLSVAQSCARRDVGFDEFHDHAGAKFENARAAESWEIRSQALNQGAFQSAGALGTVMLGVVVRGVHGCALREGETFFRRLRCARRVRHTRGVPRGGSGGCRR